MTLKTGVNVRLELIEERHAQSIFDMVHSNRTYLRTWLSFVDSMQTVECAHAFVKGNMRRNNDGNEFAFVVSDNGKMVGRLGIYKIDKQNKIGEIGYWIIESSQGQGIITKSCEALIAFGFNALQLNRIEIKCGTENFKSKAIPERLNFTHEGIIRQGELLYDRFIDLNLYSLLKSKN